MFATPGAKSRPTTTYFSRCNHQLCKDACLISSERHTYLRKMTLNDDLLACIMYNYYRDAHYDIYIKLNYTKQSLLHVNINFMLILWKNDDDVMNKL